MPKTKKNKTSKKNKNPLMSEVISITSIALSIFFAIAIFLPNAGGFIGNFIGDISRGLFGVGAFAIPFLIVGVGVYILFNKSVHFDMNKFVVALALFCLAITFIHISSDSHVYDTNPLSIFMGNFSTRSVTNGGLVGAIIGSFFLAVFGRVGTYIIIFFSLIILCVLITGRSFVSLLVDFFDFIKLSFNKVSEFRDYEDDDEDEEDYVEEPKRLRRRKASKNETNLEDDPHVPENIIHLPKHKPRQRVQLIHEDILMNSQPTINNVVTTDFERSTTPHSNGEIFINTSPQEKTIIKNIPDKKIKDTEKSSSSKTLNLFSEDEIEDEDFEGNEDTHIDSQENEDTYINSEKDENIYIFPPIELLSENPNASSGVSKSQVYENSQKLEETLKSFGVSAKVIEINKGPTVTRYELSPGAGVKVSKISGLADDLALSLAANGIRIEAPIPGKSAVGIEVPNKEAEPVFFREVLDTDDFKNFPSNLAFALGKDIAGNVVISDIGKMPHLLIAGATGSGKSVCINTLIVSLLYKSSPEDVKLIMIDPKVVELSVYNGIPHLLIPVVTDPKKAASALNWAVKEMLNRYELFATANVRDLKGYNNMITADGQTKLPQIVIIIDELADLMMAAPNEVEDAICRLAQMARAAGLHLIIATQRPSVDVITGVIKANVPSRLAFSVSSGVDSRTILDSVGAEKLLGRGDMLFCPIGMSKPLRIQGAFIQDKEVESIVNFLKSQTNRTYNQEMIDTITSSSNSLSLDEDLDELFEEAVEFIIEKDKASASLLQKRFRIGYQRASRLVDSLEDKGIIGLEGNGKTRKVLLTATEWENLKNNTTANNTDDANNQYQSED